MARSHRPLLMTAALAVLAIVVPDRAQAGFPPGYPNSTVPTVIALVGSQGGVPASGFGAFEVIVRDLANNPVVGATVAIDLSNAPDLTLCSDQVDPSLTVHCQARVVTTISDVNGRARFTLVGQGNSTGARSFLHAGRIYADGFLIGSPTVCAYDQDGVHGVSGNDLSVWLEDFAASPTIYGRSDYDNSGAIGGNDLSFWLRAFASGTQTASCAASCP